MSQASDAVWCGGTALSVELRSFTLAVNVTES